MSSNPKNKKTDKRTAMVRIICVILCLLMVGSLLINAIIVASAKSSSELKKELDALKNEAQEIINAGLELQDQLDANASETQTTIQQKSAIDQQITITEAEIQNANAQIRQYSLLIAEKQSELEDALEEQARMNEAYKARLRAMEESGSVSYWSILFKASSFSDLLSRIDSIREVAEADQRMLREIKAMADAIAEDRLELEEEMKAQEDAKAVLAENEAVLQTQRAEADALLLQLKEESDNLTEEFLANEEAEAEARAAVMAAQAEYEAALSAEEAARLAAQNKNNVAGGGGSSSNVSPSTSGFSSPLNYLNVTCAYGWRIHPLWGDRRFHTGVDLAGNQGDPIYAIASGTVTSAYYNEANGYMVALSHGGGYGSLYAHMTGLIVSSGQYVSQGQVIGYVGSTGWSTGPHLHVEIHVNGATVNPMDYIG